MPAANEKSVTQISVKPVLDRKAVADLIREYQAVQKKISKIKTDWSAIAKQSKKSLTDLNQLTGAAQHFSKALSKSARDSFKELESLGDELKQAAHEAEGLKEQYAAAGTTEEKEKYGKELDALATRMKDLNKQVVDHQKMNKKAGRELAISIKKQKEYQKELAASAEYTGKDFGKDFITQSLKGLTGVSALKAAGGALGGTIAKGLKGYHARKAETAAATGGDVGTMGKLAGAIGTALASMGALAGVMGALVDFIKKASDHMATLNKAMLQGSTTAGDLYSSGQEYAIAITEVRNAAVQTNTSMARLGVTSEDSLKNIAAFSKQASGSIVKTRDQLKEMGGEGGLASGMEEFSRNAILYGKALDMQSTEVASTMGDFVSEVGYSATNVQGLMRGIVASAADANIPISKFADIFRQMAPNIDLFTNRIEELTGMMKVFGRTLSPKDLQKFMQTMSKGFDTMEFKQRLKMALVIGPAKVTKILEKDFAKAGDVISGQLQGLGPNFKKALSGESGDINTAVAKVMAEAQAKGVTGATIEAAQKLGRATALLKKGGVLNLTTAMRGAGAMARMNMMQQYAGAFTHGDIEGLGEHVVKQLGVSEDEYSAIISLKNNMALNVEAVKKTGRLADKHTNDNLKKMFKLDRKSYQSDQDFEDAFEAKMQALSPDDLQDSIMQASSMDMDQAKDMQDKIDDVGSAQVNELMSIGDKIDIVLGVVLEKIYNDMGSVLDVINDIFNWFTREKDDVVLLKQISNNQRANEKAGYAPEQLASMKETSDKLSRLVKLGTSGTQIAASFPDVFIHSRELQQKDQGAYNSALIDTFGENAKKFSDALESGDSKTTTEMLDGLDKSKAVSLIAQLQRSEAKNGIGIIKETKETRKKFPTKADVKNIAAGGIDPEYIKKYGGAPDLAGGPPAGGSTPAGGSGVIKEITVEGVGPGTGTGVRQPDTAASGPTADVKDTAEAVIEQQKNTEEIVDIQTQHLGTTNDIYELLKKGIKFENSWMLTKYGAVVKKASLDALRPALMEMLIAYFKISGNDDLKSAISDMGGDMIAHGATGLDLLSALPPGTTITSGEDLKSKLGYASGGYVDTPGPVHVGEYVVPRGGALVKEGGGNGGGSSTTIGSITINGTNLNPQQLQNAIHNGVVDAMDDQASKH